MGKTKTFGDCPLTPEGWLNTISFEISHNILEKNRKNETKRFNMTLLLLGMLAIVCFTHKILLVLEYPTQYLTLLKGIIFVVFAGLVIVIFNSYPGEIPVNEKLAELSYEIVTGQITDSNKIRERYFECVGRPIEGKPAWWEKF